MNRYWGFILLVGVILGPGFSGANVDICRGVPGFVEPEPNNFMSYIWTPDPNVAGGCLSVDPICGGIIDAARLSQMSWFINPIKDPFGQRYRANAIDIFRIQCPAGNLLHLFPQFLDVQLVGDCTPADFVTVEAGTSTSQTLFCGTDITAVDSFYNFGRGMFVEEGNATITFCTNNDNEVGLGFVFRATCIDPELFLLPNCVDFQFYLDWDAEFTDLRLRPPFVAPPNTFQPHKRSVSSRRNDRAPWKMQAMKSMNILTPFMERKMMDRQKRFVFSTFSLATGECATYNNFQFVLDRNDGNPQAISANGVFAFNPIIGTRLFQNSSVVKFNGPAEIEYNQGIVIVRSYSLGNITTFFLPPPIEAEVINTISTYMYDNYVRPYPIINGEDPDSLPLKNVTDSGDFVRINDIRLLSEIITEGTCRRVVVEELSPARFSAIDESLADYCRFFFYSCNPYLQAICSQVLLLNTIPRAKK